MKKKAKVSVISKRARAILERTRRARAKLDAMIAQADE